MDIALLMYIKFPTPTPKVSGSESKITMHYVKIFLNMLPKTSIEELPYKNFSFVGEGAAVVRVIMITVENGGRGMTLITVQSGFVV